jgi:hypothetical protein
MKAQILAASCALAAAGPAFAQPLWDSFDQYSASPAGEPLAGQGDWALPAGAEAGWSVYTFGGNPFGLEPAFGSTQFAAAGGLGVVGRAEAQRPLMVYDRTLHITARIATRFVSRPPPGGEKIGRMAVAARGESPAAALVARWSDTSGEQWSADLFWHDAEGVARTTELFTDLEAGVWYHWSLHLDLDFNTIYRVELGKAGERPMRVSSPDWYLAGGAAGGPEPDTIVLTAGEPGASGNVLAVDIIEPLSGFCNIDCDLSGVLDFFDFLCFQTGFVVGAPWADCDGSGEYDLFDFLCYQDEFWHGCGP